MGDTPPVWIPHIHARGGIWLFLGWLRRLGDPTYPLGEKLKIIFVELKESSSIERPLEAGCYTNTPFSLTFWMMNNSLRSYGT
jgi:hypothetical protein